MMRKERGQRSRFLFLLFVMLIVALQSARCQVPAEGNSPNNPPKKWQLKFSVGSNFIPHPFDGFKVYLQRMISGSRAVRFGAGLRDYRYESDYRTADIYPPEDNYRKIDIDAGQLVFSAAVDYIGYFKSKKKIRPYLGIGPFFDCNILDMDQTDRPAGDSSNPRTHIMDREILGAGFNAIFGAEWQLKSYLVFQVEYNLRFLFEKSSRRFMYDNPDISPEFINERTVFYSSYRIEPDNLKTGLSLFF